MGLEYKPDRGTAVAQVPFVKESQWNLKLVDFGSVVSILRKKENARLNCNRITTFLLPEQIYFKCVY